MQMQIKFFNKLGEKHVFTYCVFYDDEIPCKQARLSDTDLLVLGVIDNFELSVNVVSYICEYILKYFILKSKCLDCLRMLTDTDKGV